VSTSDLRREVGPPARRDLLDVEWIRFVLAVLVVGVSGFVLEAVL
jgi:hypothetical protein